MKTLNYRAYAYLLLLSLYTSTIYTAQFITDAMRTTMDSLPIQVVHTPLTLPEKEYTVAVYIAARNNLERFVAKNLMQMMQVGTNHNLTIVVHLDSMRKNRTMTTQRFVIYQDKIVQIGEMEPMDSGKPETLIDFCRWAFTHFPCRQPMLTLWSHGIGDLDISEWMRLITLSELSSIEVPNLYVYNPDTDIIEINRSIGFLDYVSVINQLYQPLESPMYRSICFDDITGHALTNHDVGQALEYVRDTYLHGNPFACLLCDACLMNSIGFAYSLKQYSKKPVAHVLIGSQEAVLATGYDYARTLAPLREGNLSPVDFATHVTKAFADTYRPIIRDYTQSALVLDSIDPLYEAVDALALLLVHGMTYQHDKSVEKFIESCSSYYNCTCFAEPSYKDMSHLFTNMRSRVSDIVLHDAVQTEELRQELAYFLDSACALIKQTVIANSVGRSLPGARGISIYLPRKGGRIHHSYQDTDFGKQSAWLTLLQTYLAKR